MVSRIASLQTSDWVKWIANDDGGSNAQSIDGDEDGFFTSHNRILIDLSHGLSQKLGRQLSQMSTYELDYLKIEMVNFDDANDNEAGLQVSGDIYYWSPTAHRIDAMQMARQLEKHYESSEVDEDSFLLSTDRDYKGMRFNYDADSQVKFATKENFSVLAGTEWDMNELMGVYGNMQAPASNYSNALWTNRCGGPNSMGFDCSYTNYTRLTGANNFDPKSDPFEMTKPISVLGGLLMVNFTHSSVGSTLNTNDDDYLIRVTVGVKGWSDF